MTAAVSLVASGSEAVGFAAAMTAATVSVAREVSRDGQSSKSPGATTVMGW